MKKKNIFQKITYAIVSIAMSIMTIAAGLFPTANAVYTHADGAATDFDQTDIMEDLTDIDVLLYPKNPFGTPDVIRFVEYCYSTRPLLQEDYGLYLYVYNPTETPVATLGNVADMAVSYAEDGEPNKWENVPLTLLDSTGRFLKFKVTTVVGANKDDDSFLKRAQDYAVAHDGVRRYDVAGIQLYFTDGTYAKDGGVGKTYKWTGFAAGCGTVYDEEPTLKIEALETLHLDVHPTFYRPEGSNGTNEYTQDTLHSVYFSVPNEMIEKFGELYAVHATYLAATLKPMLLTGNQSAYNAIFEILGTTLNGYNENLPLYLSNVYVVEDTLREFECYFGFNAQNDYFKKFLESSYDYQAIQIKHIIDTLYLLFSPDEFGEDIADDYIVSSKKIKQQMENSATKDWAGELIQGANGNYSKAIFESVDETYTDLTLTTDDTMKLNSVVIDRTFWEKLFGGSHVESSDTFDNIQAVYPVKKSDITGSKAADCSNLYISTGDYDDFCATLNEAEKNNETLYLFRYRTSEYVAAEAELWAPADLQAGSGSDYIYIDNGDVPVSGVTKDTNARFFQQSVDLDFDVIDVTFRNEDGETVIPVVADPLDIVHDSTPALNTTSDKEFDFWSLIFGILGVILLFFVIKYVFKFIGGVIKLWIYKK